MNNNKQTVILIVEDEDVTRHEYKSILRKYENHIDSVHIIEVDNGNDAYEIYNKNSDIIDLVISDYKLEGMNGITLLKKIRKKDRFIPIIIITGSGNEFIAVEAMKNGATDYITKDSTYRLENVIVSSLEKEKFRKNLFVHQEALRNSNRRLAKFASVVAHDLQSPLMVINAQRKKIEALKEGAEARTVKAIEKVFQSTEKMGNYIADVLEYSRINMNGTKVESVDMNKLLLEVLGEFEESIEELGIKIELGTLPTISAKKSHLYSLFQNLLSNCVKYRREVPLVISIYQEPDVDAFCVISVKDNGKGIEKEYQEQIFHEFFRCDPEDMIKGTGIGLSTCKRVIEEHNGKINVISEVGKGSIFQILLPYNFVK